MDDTVVVRNTAVLATALALFVVAAPATVLGADAGTQAAEDSEELAPGVYENGTVNTTALYAAHSEQLREQGYQADETLTIELNDSTFVSAETESESDGENTSVSSTLSIIGLEYEIDVWANESQKIVRITEDDNVSYKVYERGPPAFADTETPDAYDDNVSMNGGMSMDHMSHGMGPGEMPVPGKAVLLLDKIAGEFTVENETSVDDRTAYTLSAPVELPEDAEGNVTGEITLVVDEDGVVHSATVTADSTEYGSESEYTLELEQLGVDSVEQPSWVEEVPANATVYGPPDEQPGSGPPGDVPPERP